MCNEYYEYLRIKFVTFVFDSLISMQPSITIKHSIFINKPREIVWDFTQNYTKRALWDDSIIETETLQTAPERIIRLKLKRNTLMTFVYKLDDRPNKTTLVAKEIKSPFIESAGGSWKYEEQQGGTLWTQTNTLGFKNNILLTLLLPFYKWFFERQIKTAMKIVKLIIERMD